MNHPDKPLVNKARVYKYVSKIKNANQNVFCHH